MNVISKKKLQSKQKDNCQSHSWDQEKAILSKLHITKGFSFSPIDLINFVGQKIVSERVPEKITNSTKNIGDGKLIFFPPNVGKTRPLKGHGLSLQQSTPGYKFMSLLIFTQKKSHMHDWNFTNLFKIKSSQSSWLSKWWAVKAVTCPNKPLTSTGSKFKDTCKNTSTWKPGACVC